MPITAYPLPADVEKLLLAAGVPAEKIAELDLGNAVIVAVESWESDTGYHPFLASESDEAIELRFSPPRSATLELAAGFVTISEVREGNVTLIEGTHYELRPSNANTRGEPTTELRFFYRARNDIFVSGIAGYNFSLTQRVFDAIARRAALHVAPELMDALASTAASAGGEIKSKKSGDVEIQYTTASESKTSLKNAVPRFQTFYDAALADYRLRLFGL